MFDLNKEEMSGNLETLDTLVMIASEIKDVMLGELFQGFSEQEVKDNAEYFSGFIDGADLLVEQFEGLYEYACRQEGYEAEPITPLN